MKMISILLVSLFIHLPGINAKLYERHLQADFKIVGYGSLEIINNSGTSILEELDQPRNMYLFIRKVHLGGNVDCTKWQLNRTLSPGQKVRYEVRGEELLLVKVCLENDACRNWREYYVKVGESTRYSLK